MVTPEQREACVEGAAGQIGEERARETADRADGYFDERYPATVEDFLQAMLRETWRDDHGGTSRWDRTAKVAGVYAIGKVIL